MLPPPITRPTEAPVCITATTSSASRPTVSKSYPAPFSPASASPESLRSTRGYFKSATCQCSLFAELIANEATDLDVLARLRRRLLHEVTDRLASVANPLLVHERDILVEGLDFSFDDLFDHVLRLAAGPNLFVKDAAL